MKSTSKSSKRDLKEPAETEAGRPASPTDEAALWTARAPGWLLLWVGWLLPQVLLLGPALVGQTVNLPVDLLATPHLYLPANAAYQHVVPYHRLYLLDLLLGFQDSREFSTQEFRAGRLPLWQPSNFAGAPFPNWNKYSPFELPYYVFPVPTTLAWMSVLQAMTCGLGMWLFLRRGLSLSYWPAAFAAWCAPLCGFMSTWQGYPLRGPACWLPWLLWLVQGAIKDPWRWSTVGLAVLTAILVLTGAPDIGGLVLITAGFYALWRLVSDQIVRIDWRRGASTALSLGAAWVVAFLVAAPFVWPMFEYDRTGARMQARAAGSEERPPVGPTALPAIALPDVDGTDRTDSIPNRNGNLVESASGACAGLLAVFWLAPLAWCHQKFRRESMFFSVLAVAGLAWTLGLPGFVDVFRIKPLNMLSYNRWVFATADAILVLSAIGMEFLRTGRLRFRSSFFIPILLLAVFGLWCLFRVFEPPEPFAGEIREAVRDGRVGSLSFERLRAAERSSSLCYAVGAALSLAAVLGWLTSFWSGRRFVWCRLALIGLIPVQLFWFAWQERRQADRSLFFPPVEALKELAALPPGRIWGIDCLPPNLGHFHRRQDIRGYDAVDPVSFVKLFELACQPPSRRAPYAMTQEAVPALLAIDHRVKLHPVADLLNVRYLVLRTPPPVDFPVVVHQDDYWILENRNALPRAFVAHSVKVVKNDQEALAIMQDPRFDPRKTVLMTTHAEVADATEGTADIRYETPTHASLNVDLRTAGMVVISDMWDPDWRAKIDGRDCPINRVDSALRGLRVPAGTHRIVLTYEPLSVRRGFQIAGAAGLLLLLWSAAIVMTTVRARTRV